MSPEWTGEAAKNFLIKLKLVKGESRTLRARSNLDGSIINQYNFGNISYSYCTEFVSDKDGNPIQNADEKVFCNIGLDIDRATDQNI